MNSKFIFYQEVKPLFSERTKEYIGIRGVIFGIGEDEGNGYSYAVYFPDNGVTASFWEAELEATNNFFKREDFYE